jgi:pyruvyl transferase EpsO
MEDYYPYQPMVEIKRELAVISTVIPRGSQIIYVDFPVYENIGDLLIMKGTEQFFRDYQITVRKRYSFLNFSAAKSLPQDWIIVCQGGGNLGDLYSRVQQFRERVVQSYPNHRIVVLPQTIHFTNPIQQAESLRIMGEHRDLHLFVRDHASFRMAANVIQKVYLAPDMAHQLYPLQALFPSSKKTLGLLRTDDEIVQGMFSPIPCNQVIDWPQLFNACELRMVHWMVRGFQFNRIIGNMLPLQKLWYRMVENLVLKALRLYSDYEQIVTSRLHGHILACLLDKPNHFLDNSYGKNSSYYRAWTYRVEYTTAVFGFRGEEDEVERTSRLKHRHLYSESSG